MWQSFTYGLCLLFSFFPLTFHCCPVYAVKRQWSKGASSTKSAAILSLKQRHKRWRLRSVHLPLWYWCWWEISLYLDTSFAPGVVSVTGGISGEPAMGSGSPDPLLWVGTLWPFACLFLDISTFSTISGHQWLYCCTCCRMKHWEVFLETGTVLATRGRRS